MGGREHTRFQVWSGSAAADFNSPVYETIGARGLILLLDATAVSAADTLDIKIQAETYNGSGVYYDVDGASFAQVTTVAGTWIQMLQIYPRITAATNKKVSAVMPSRWRVVFDLTEVGGGTLAIVFTLTAEVLW